MVATVVAGLVAYLLFWPVPIDPVAYDPPPFTGLVGPLTPNQELLAAEVVTEVVEGPEDVAVAPDGALLVGTHDGKILRVSPDGATVETLAETGGRPLGLAWGADDQLIIADAMKGLLSMAPDGAIDTLSTTHGGRAYAFTDDVDVASDGTIYFSDASDIYGYGHHIEDVLEARPHGRLLAFDPTTRRTSLVLDDLHFANGVAVAADDRFVLVNETNRFRVIRVWLKGPKAGEREIFCDNLPGYPDGISRSPRGTFWVAIYGLRNPRLDPVSRSPFLKKLFLRLPEALMPLPAKYGLVIELDAEGKVLRSLHDPTGTHVWQVTSVEEVGGTLHFGTLHAPRLTRLTLQP